MSITNVSNRKEEQVRSESVSNSCFFCFRLLILVIVTVVLIYYFNFIRIFSKYIYSTSSQTLKLSNYCNTKKTNI